ncbi:MAG: rhomboid family intramembrane serine protease [Phycisphaerales bacterium]|nr:rhomboid family intramembrane serine protease [Phycisphaerales bacterium]
MGIYDRGYYRDEGGAGGRFRFGRVSALSVTTWIILINVAVFVVDAFMVRHGLPVFSGGHSLVEPLPPDDQLKTDKAYVDLDQFGRATPADPHRVGSVVFRLVRDEQTNQVVATEEYVVRPPLEALGFFSTWQGFHRVEVWRFVTYQFLHDHGNILHLAMNMFGLYMFGLMVEEQLGRKKYLAFYLVCGIFGGISYLLLNLLGRVFHVQLPGMLFTDVTTPLIGASASVFGVIMACARIAPDLPVQIIFVPITFRMKWLAYGWVGLAAFNLLFGKHNQGGDAAHIGGAIAGAYFIRHSHLLLDFFDVFGDSREKKGGRARKPRIKPPPEVLARRREHEQIDRILDKVSAQGIGSLTAKEKRILARDTEKRRRRAGED